MAAEVGKVNTAMLFGRAGIPKKERLASFAQAFPMRCAAVDYSHYCNCVDSSVSPVLFHWITVGHRLWTVTFLLFAVDELGALVLSARSPACGRKVPGRRVLDYFRCKDIDIAEAGEFCSMACSLALNASFESFGLRVEGVNKRTNDV